jgi:hypothetical protein
VVLDDDVVADLDVALDVAEVAGIRADPAGRRVQLLLHVLALPGDGPAERDSRRAVVLSVCPRSEILARAESGKGRYGSLSGWPTSQT